MSQATPIRMGPIRISELGPRDGLQNEAGFIETADKIRFIDLLSGAGFAEIEVTSFVSPRWIPQLRDADAVLAGIARRPGVVYSALVPNEAGLERALAARVQKISVFTAASESFSRRNTNASIAESIDRLAPVVRRALALGLPVRGYVSCAIACPFEGAIAPAAVAEVVGRLRALGVEEIDLGDTIGVAVPADIERLYKGIESHCRPDQTTLHLHDTRGTALACVARAIDLGVTSFDASCVGLGGCPYAPGAAGNLATEDLVYFCERSGLACGVDLSRLLEAGRFIAERLGRAAVGRVFRALTSNAQGGAVSATEGTSWDPPMSSSRDPTEPTAGDALAAAIGEGAASVVDAFVRSHHRAGRRGLSFIDEASEASQPPMSVQAEVRVKGVGLGRLVSTSDDREALTSTAAILGRFLELDAELRELRVLSLTDELTGAGNRRAFERFVPEVIAEAREAGRSLPLMVFDVDNFKYYNDRFGHAAGDEVLRETVTLLSAAIRRGDRVFRIGGDEFVVVFSDPSPPREPGSPPIESVAQIASRFQQRIRELHLPALGGLAPGAITISAGLANFPDDGTEASVLLDAADQRALASKRGGKDLITFGSSDEG